ncbi:hypothetical protein JNW90_24230 [Micromonospora sp. STR1s_5]|nr:hypothetical protein [Micromonospora sp. STR1s_5]
MSAQSPWWKPARWPWKPPTARSVWLRLLTLDHSQPDARTTAADLRAAHAMLRGAEPRWVCPSTGLDVARAITLPWCCAAGRHPGMVPRWRQVLVVVEDLDGPGLPRWWGGARKVQMMVRTQLLLDANDPLGWRWWAVGHVSRWLTGCGELRPDRRLRVQVLDIEREHPQGLRRHAVLCPTVDLTYGEDPWHQPPASTWWARCPELGRLTAAALLKS